MKILQINASYKPAYIYGGPTMSVSKLCEMLAEAGCEVEVFTTTANGVSELPVTPGSAVIVDGVEVTYFPRLTKDHTHYSPALLRELRHRIHKFDVVHIHAWWNLVSVLACGIAHREKVPVIISPRGTLSHYSFSNRSSFSKWVLHQLIGKKNLEQSYFHVTSFREGAALRSVVTAKGIYNIPNFVDFPKTNPETRQIDAKGPFKLIFFSRIEEKKGLEILFEALKNIGIPYLLTIAGDGDASYITSLRELAIDNRIDTNISWIGFQYDQKFEVLGDHELMVLPSYDENFGNVVIESLSVGTPVLISDRVGLAGYVSQHQLGWVCSNNADAFRDELISIYQNRESLAPIRHIAPATIRRDFDEQTLRDRYVDMYKEIIYGTI